MYNTNFKVKYQDIKEELLKIITQEEAQDVVNPEYKYSVDDVLNICDKLYRDELVSVFYAENIFDDKIDINSRYILEQMMLNNDFKVIVNEFKHDLFMDSTDLPEQEKTYFTENIDFIVILTFLKKEFFYVFHKCICQQLTLGTIERELLDEFKKIISVN